MNVPLNDISRLLIPDVIEYSCFDVVEGKYQAHKVKNPVWCKATIIEKKEVERYKKIFFQYKLEYVKEDGEETNQVEILYSDLIRKIKE